MISIDLFFFYFNNGLFKRTGVFVPKFQIPFVYTHVVVCLKIILFFIDICPMAQTIHNFFFILSTVIFFIPLM